MKARVYLWTAPGAFLLLTALWTPLWLRTPARAASSEFGWTIAGLALVFGLLHAGLWREYRQATKRQLPAYILLLLTSALFVAVVVTQYDRPAAEFPWDTALYLIPAYLAFLLFPFYGIALLLSWLLHRLFGVSWYFAAPPGSSSGADRPETPAGKSESASERESADASAGASTSQPEFVKVYDSTTRETTTIPASELTGGMIRVRLQGSDEIVWMDAAELKEGPLRHPPFSGELREKILWIQDSLAEVYPKTYEDWEEGFRRDTTPENEIALWLHCCRCYRAFLERHPTTTVHERHEAFRILIACLNGTPTTIFQMVTVQLLPPTAAQAIVDEYFAGFGNG